MLVLPGTSTNHVTLNPILPGGGEVFGTTSTLEVFYTQLRTFLKTYRNLFKSESLSIAPLLLPWQYSLGRVLWKDRVFRNSNDVTVTSFLNQSQPNFAISLQIPSYTFVLSLSKIRLFMFPWQHILETALMQNEAIQLNNNVTVTLFLNRSFQNFEVF